MKFGAILWKIYILPITASLKFKSKNPFCTYLTHIVVIICCTLRSVVCNTVTTKSPEFCVPVALTNNVFMAESRKLDFTENRPILQKPIFFKNLGKCILTIFFANYVKKWIFITIKGSFKYIAACFFGLRAKTNIARLQPPLLQLTFTVYPTPTPR